MSQPLAADSLKGKTALVTGSSRGIGADTVRYFAEAGANVVINFRNKAPRAEKLATELRGLGVEALVVGADLTDPESVQAMFDEVQRVFGGLDILVLNASGGMESGMAEDYALKLNRDAQVSVLETALPLLAEGSRVVFVTSHQAHFIRTTPTMPEYEPVALSKRAGEDALRERIPALDGAGRRVRRGLGRHDRGHDHRDAPRAREPRRDRRPPRIGRQALQRQRVRRRGRARRRRTHPRDNTRLVGDTASFAGE